MTTHDEEYRRLLRRSLIVTVSCILAVVICYFWVDRTVAIGLSVPMLLSLVAMNYHFVCDVIAGSVLGALVAAYAVHLARLNKCHASIPVSDSSKSRATRANALRDLWSMSHFEISR